MPKKFLRILIHIGGILVFLSIPLLFLPDEVRILDFYRIPPAMADLATLILVALYFYANYYLLIPRLYFEKRPLSFILLTLLFLSLVVMLPSLFLMGGADMHGPHAGQPGSHRDMDFMFRIENKLLLFLLAFFFSLMLRINFRWRQAERERTSAELSNLKAQINPHFLFNTLNSIYSLALDKSDDTAPAVVKLSGMMRYVISEANNELVPLEKEIKYVKDYVELQKIRLGNTVAMDFIVSGDATGGRIAPLILIPFVENAFKYGVNPEQDSRIMIHLNFDATKIDLRVSNRKVRHVGDESERSGIGIRNTRDRLSHLYPSRHHLEIRALRLNIRSI